MVEPLSQPDLPDAEVVSAARLRDDVVDDVKLRACGSGNSTIPVGIL